MPLSLDPDARADVPLDDSPSPPPPKSPDAAATPPGPCLVSRFLSWKDVGELRRLEREAFAWARKAPEPRDEKGAIKSQQSLAEETDKYNVAAVDCILDACRLAIVDWKEMPAKRGAYGPDKLPEVLTLTELLLLPSRIRQAVSLAENDRFLSRSPSGTPGGDSAVAPPAESASTPQPS